MRGRTAFVTGATGFLGSFLVTFLLGKGYRVVALVRGANARERLLGVLHEVGQGHLPADFAERVRVIEGDVRTCGFGLTQEVFGILAYEVDEIWHCAASFKFQDRDREEVCSHNVTGAKNLLDFALRCNRRKTTPFFYVSTAYAAPTSDGVAREELAPEEAQARNLYEWSKQAAERLVDAYRKDYGLPATIFRPSIVIGHSQSGEASRFTGYYDVLRALTLLVRSLEVNLGGQFDRNLHLRIRARPDTRLNLVPIDFVVEAMWRLSRAGRHEAFIFHITNDTPTLVSDLFRYVCEELGVTGIELVGEESFQKQPMTSLERLFDRRTRFQAPYLLDGPAFDMGHFRSVLPPDVLPCPEIDAALMRKVNQSYLRTLDQRFEQPCAPAVFPSPVSSPVPTSEPAAQEPVARSIAKRLHTITPLWGKERKANVPVGSLADCGLAS